VTQTLERFELEAEAVKKDDMKFYEYIISTAILHGRASRVYMEAKGKSSPASWEEEAQKTILASDPD
jgi:hypothetical protein